MERELLNTFLPGLPGWCKNEPDFNKAWECILQLRQLALDYIWKPRKDALLTEELLRPYYLALLASTLPIVYYETRQFPGAGEQQKIHEHWQKRFAYTSAGMLCARLDPGAAQEAAQAVARQTRPSANQT